MIEVVKFYIDSFLRYACSAENAPKETAERVSLLALAWDRKVQVAKLVKSDLKICGKWSLDSSAIGVAWLNDQVWMILHFLTP